MRAPTLAFYAPLKSPRHPRPSGDRQIAQWFMAALKQAGWAVELASELRAWEGAGDAARQADIEASAGHAAVSLLETYRRRPPAERPRCWFTYHLYHKAPDWIGPAVSAALNIPYVLAEASAAAKQRHGPWRAGYAQSLVAIRQAAAIFNLNPRDLPALLPIARNAEVVAPLKPFADLPAPPAGPQSRWRHRRELAAAQHIDADPYWLACVAMMRADSKLDSYRILADTVAALERDDWRLLVVGDGAAQSAVMDLFANRPRSRPRQVHFLGRRGADFIYPLMRASDLLVWPARNEALGMAALEALACGLPVVAGDSGGIAGIVAHQRTGLLLHHANDRDLAAAMARAIDNLLADPATLHRMSVASTVAYRRRHHIDIAAAAIGKVLAKLT